MAVKMPFEKPKEVDIDQLLNKGGMVKEDFQEKAALKNECSFLNLRIPNSLLAELDNLIAKKVGITRTGWILQAIQKSIEEENER